MASTDTLTQGKTKTIHILLIEDNPRDVGWTKEILTSSEVTRYGNVLFEIICAEGLSTGKACLDAQRIDAVLLDLTLPDSRGIDTFRDLHEHSPDVPIIVMTCTDDDEIASQTVREGAQDFLVKGTISRRLLVQSITYAIERSKWFEK